MGRMLCSCSCPAYCPCLQTCQGLCPGTDSMRGPDSRAFTRALRAFSMHGPDSRAFAGRACRRARTYVLARTACMGRTAERSHGQ